ncbi:hypothetical protein [Microbacterium sp. NPDC076895]|uniref:hypothetical protein n=1 Tax=unclassified Microbacterium TaxID=2609290 RepID=UPI0034305BF8
MGEVIESWSDFNVAMAGATAALAGLVIVAASVNIVDIVKEKSLTARLGAAVATLVLAIVATMTGLIPSVSPLGYGAVVVAATAIAAAFQVVAARSVIADRRPTNRLRGVKSAVGFAPLAAYTVGGILLLAGAPAGLVWLAAGALLAIVVALVVSWVVLVEILR